MGNFHIFRVQYHGAKHSISITSDRWGQRIFLEKDNRFKHSSDQALEHLKELGFNILGEGDGPEWDYIISDTFNPLK